MRKMIGQRFGMLTVVGVANARKYLCHCDCGNDIAVWDRTLFLGKKDCGCVKFHEKDLTGKRFVRLLVLGPALSNRIGEWRCRCDCGKEVLAVNRELKLGITKSCGCWTKDRVCELGKRTVIQLGGKRFGRLVVESRAGTQWGKALWRCRCDCGKERILPSRALISGNTKSCGCLRNDNAAKMGRSRLKDLAGQRFGRLTAIKYLSRQYWLCQCDCGNQRTSHSACLLREKTVDCQNVRTGVHCVLRRIAS